MKSVLISIQPKWCELIASGKKTIEVRKTRPKLETPFKCYIYCTKSKEIMFNVFLNEPEKEVEYLSGKVIGEFVCDRLDVTYPILIPNTDVALYTNEWVLGSKVEDTCLTLKDISEYGKGKPLYGWHISDLKIYDKPKELGEFWKADKCPYNSGNSCTYKYHCFRAGESKSCGEQLARPPQSWCYVDEL